MQQLDSNWSIYSPLVSSIVQAGEQLGAPVDALLKKVNIDKQLLKSPEHRFSVAQVFELFELTASFTNRSDLGIYVGRILYINCLNLQLYMSTVCRTFREYVNLIPSQLRINGDIGEVVMKAENQFVRLEWHPLWQPSAQQRFLSDIVLTMSAAIVNSLCLLPIPVEQAHFSYNKPESLTLLRTTFGDKLHFVQGVSCLYFSRDSLNYPLTRLNGDLNSTLTRPVDHLFGEQQPKDSLISQIHQTLSRLLPQGDINIDRVAAELNMSRRTLQRRLSERDTQFLQILQQIRSDLAIKYLSDERLSVTEIAFMLGYRDQGSFSTAFKSWHGMAPIEYRFR